MKVETISISMAKNAMNVGWGKYAEIFLEIEGTKKPLKVTCSDKKHSANLALSIRYRVKNVKGARQCKISQKKDTVYILPLDLIEEKTLSK